MVSSILCTAMYLTLYKKHAHLLIVKYIFAFPNNLDKIIYAFAAPVQPMYLPYAFELVVFSDKTVLRHLIEAFDSL